MRTVKERVNTCRLICKMQKDPEFGKKLGLEISPKFEKKKETERPEGGAKG